MHSTDIPIWFFIGVLLIAYGALILGYGLYELGTGTMAVQKLPRVHLVGWIIAGARPVLRSALSPEPQRLMKMRQQGASER